MIQPQSRRPAGPVWAVVLAAGGGARFGGPKQYAELAGLTLLERAVRSASGADGVVVVLPPGDDRPAAGHGTPDRRTAIGGATRAESVRSGLAALPADAEIVVITDAAHPLASPELYRSVVAAVRAGADGALPGLPLADAIKRLEPLADPEADPDPDPEAEPEQGEPVARLGRAGATTPAGGSVSAQMPMAFRLPALRRAHERIADAVEDSAMVTAAGGVVVVVPGETTNLHITTPADLVVAAALLPLVAGLPLVAASAT